MIRLWTILGVALAVAGSFLFWNGVNQRFSPSRRAQVTASRAAFRSAMPDTNTVRQEVIKVNIDTIHPTGDSSTATHIHKTLINPSDTTFESQTELQSKTKSVSQDITAKPMAKERAISVDDEESLKDLMFDIVERQGWTKEELAQLRILFADSRAKFRKDLLVRNSTFTETSEQYTHNLTPLAIDQCAAFWNANRELITNAAAKERVQSEYIVAILKVETNFGGYLGKESVFNVFWTLSLGDVLDVQKAMITPLNYPRSEMVKRMTKRALWARGQLRDLLYMARHGGKDPIEIIGSFAGAFGLAQFIPSSYRAFGRDGDSDNVIDLDNAADAAASIAYYLNENGWPKTADRARRRKAILTYNRSQHYADCVMALADSLTRRWNNQTMIIP